MHCRLPCIPTLIVDGCLWLHAAWAEAGVWGMRVFVCAGGVRHSSKSLCCCIVASNTWSNGGGLSVLLVVCSCMNGHATCMHPGESLMICHDGPCMYLGPWQIMEW